MIQMVVWFIGLIGLVWLCLYKGAKYMNEDADAGMGFSVLGIIFYILLIGFIVNFLIYGVKLGIIPKKVAIPTGNLDVWISFFGSLIGAALGGIITIYVLNRNIVAQNKNTMDIIEQYEKQLEKSDEQMKYKYRPCLDFSFIDETDVIDEAVLVDSFRNIDLHIRIKIDNGQRTVDKDLNTGYLTKIVLENVSDSLAYDIRYTYILEDELRKSTTINSESFIKPCNKENLDWFIPILECESGKEKIEDKKWLSLILFIFYNDILGNEYYQNLKIGYQRYGNYSHRYAVISRSRISIPIEVNKSIDYVIKTYNN